MSDLNLDLNINNYNIKELENILNLNSSHKFIDIQTSAVNIRKELFSISSLDTNKKQEIDIFLEKISINNQSLIYVTHNENYAMKTKNRYQIK